MGQAGGTHKASAQVDGNKGDAQAINENGDAQGNGLPSQAYAKVSSYDAPSDAVGLGYSQPAYYPLPAPATVFTYQKYADVPVEIPSRIVYEAQPGPALAQSSAITKGHGSANSVAKTDYGSAISNANAQGYGHNAASSIAQSDGPALEPAVIAARAQGLHSVYTPAYVPVGHNSASSSANVNGYHGSAASAARTGPVPTRKSISWRFGTAYDQPAAYGAAKAAAVNYGQGSSAANSGVSPQGSISSYANTLGHGSAQSAATNNGYGIDNGFGNANANLYNANYAVPRADIPAGYGAIKSSASSHNGGSSIANSGTDFAGNNYVNTNSRSHLGGTAQSAAYNGGSAYGQRSSGAYNGHLGADSSSVDGGSGSANARTQGVSTGYRVVNSVANSAPHGSSRANAYAV